MTRLQIRTGKEIIHSFAVHHKYLSALWHFKNKWISKTFELYSLTVTDFRFLYALNS